MKGAIARGRNPENLAVCAQHGASRALYGLHPNRNVHAYRRTRKL